MSGPGLFPKNHDFVRGSKKVKKKYKFSFQWASKKKVTDLHSPRRSVQCDLWDCRCSQFPVLTFYIFQIIRRVLSLAKAQSLICIVLMMRSILWKERKISIKPWDVRNCIIKNEKVDRHHMMMTWESINKSSVCVWICRKFSHSMILEDEWARVICKDGKIHRTFILQ